MMMKSCALVISTFKNLFLLTTQVMIMFISVASTSEVLLFKDLIMYHSFAKPALHTC